MSSCWSLSTAGGAVRCEGAGRGDTWLGLPTLISGCHCNAGGVGPAEGGGGAWPMLTDDAVMRLLRPGGATCCGGGWGAAE